ncbi:MAG: LacI family DNA-binding transcriptional regulator [Candidatus Methylacidiphilales bacterium]|nr:LacI family DNA-binding transcriptional regulator [Candidatus Methylacidiphilales bacterium]
MKEPTASKQHQIHEELRKEILVKTWKLGDRLPTEAELAKRFDCSIGTVSKAVSLLVHEGLVERKTRLGTRVIKNAENTVGTKLDAFAFIYPSEQHEGIWRTVRGFQEAAKQAGRRVVMLSTGADYAKEAEYLARLSEFDVRGAVIYPIIPSPEDQIHFSQMLVNSLFPVVLAEVNLPGLGCPAVVIDGFHAGYTMTKHLIDKGLKRIGFFSNYAWAPFMRDRYLGYKWALGERGLQENPDWIVRESEMHPDFGNPLAESKRLAQKLLAKGKDMEGVVCANDFLALALMEAAQEQGTHLPEELSITGMDDFLTASASNPSLTTYSIPYEEMGRRAFEALHSVTVAKSESLPLETLVRGEIVVRASA